MSYDQFVMGLVSSASMETPRDQRLTAALGLVGEAIEFDGSIDEAGDCLWYLTFALNILGSDRQQELRQSTGFLPFTNESYVYSNYLFACGKFSEYIKKTTYHGKDFDQEYALELIHVCFREYRALLNVHQLLMDDVIDFNIKKLEHRYPEGFKPNV